MKLTKENAQKQADIVAKVLDEMDKLDLEFMEKALAATKQDFIKFKTIGILLSPKDCVNILEQNAKGINKFQAIVNFKKALNDSH